MKRFLITALIILIGIWGSVSIYFAAKPYWSAYVLKQIKDASEQYTPFQVNAEDIHLRFFSPGVILENVEVVTLDESLQKVTKKLNFKSVEAKLDIFRMLGGQIFVSALILDGLRGDLDFNHLEVKPKRDTKQAPISWPTIKSKILDLPLSGIIVQDINLTALIKDHQLDLENADIIIQARYDELEIKSFFPNLVLSTKKEEPHSFPVRAEFHANLSDETAKITALHLAHQNSELKSQGTIDNIQLEKLFGSDADLQISSKIQVPHIKKFLRLFNLSDGLPDIEGHFTVNTKFEVKKGKFQTKGDFETKDIKIGQFTVGNTKGTAIINQDSVIVPRLEVTHPSGTATLTEIQFNPKSDWRLKTKAQLSKLELQKLFVALGLKNIPVDLNLQGELPCEAKLNRPMELNCEATLHGTKLLVDISDGQSEPIVAVPDVRAKGSLKVTGEAVSYEAELKLPNSTGRSTGKIIYKSGFDISFEADHLDFADAESILGLGFEGTTKLKGKTWGNASYAIVEIDADAEEFWFSDYELSKLQTEIEYKAGKLKLGKITGARGVSRYQGDVTIDIGNKAIAFDVSFPFLDASDIAKSLSRHYQLPFEISGSGLATVKGKGPLQFSKLSYDFNGQLYKGRIAGESFDRLHVNFHSNEGHVLAKESFLQKGQGTLKLDGSITPKGDVSAVILADKLLLDDITHLNDLTVPVSGDLNFRATIQGPIRSPLFSIRGSLEKFSISGNELESSAFNFDVSQDSVRGNLNLMGNRVTSQFQIPIKGKTPFTLSATTNEWDFTTLLSLFGSEGLHREYSSSLSTSVNLVSPTGDIWKSSGNIKVSDLKLTRQHFGVSNKETIDIELNDGQVHISNFVLSGPESLLEVVGRNFSLTDLGFTVKGNTNLRLLHIFLPFLEDISGPASLSVRVGGHIEAPEILGSAYLDGVFVKLPGFPHPLERLTSDILFSQRRVLINTLKGDIAGGVFSGDGTIRLEGIGNLPMDVDVQIEGASLNVPNGVRSSGLARLKIEGDWFPYIIRGEYNISNALIEMNFGANSEEQKGPKRSIYLPEEVVGVAFEPLVFDIRVFLDRNVEIKNALIQGELKGEILVQGSPSNPGITGSIRAVEDTKILFREKIFEVSNATIRFTDPIEINPEIFVAAQARVVDWDVNLLVQGRANDPQIRLSSQPPLSEEDIISLLALGMISSTQSATLSSEQQQRNSQYQLGAALINQNPVNREIQERLGVEIIISSTMDDTRVVPTATVNRNITKDLTASYGRTLGQENYEQTAKLRFQINNNVAAIGSWEGREQGQTSDRLNEEEEGILGFDLEYRLEFE